MVASVKGPGLPPPRAQCAVGAMSCAVVKGQQQDWLLGTKVGGGGTGQGAGGHRSERVLIGALTLSGASGTWLAAARGMQP